MTVLTSVPLNGASWLVIAHRVGSGEFYWGITADLLVLLLTALLLMAPLWGASELGRRRFRLWGLGAAITATGVTLAGKIAEVWPGHPLFPSGHTAWAVTIAIFVVGRDRRWLPWVLPLLALLAVALVLSHYHIPADLAGGLAVGLAAGYGGFALMSRSGSGHGAAGSGPRGVDLAAGRPKDLEMP